MTPPPELNGRKRPFTLKMVCALLLVRSLLLLPVVTFYFFPDELKALGPMIDVTILDGVAKWVTVTAFAVMGVLNLAAAVGLWLFKPWAWRLAMILVGLMLTLELWRQLDGNPLTKDTVGLVLNILIVFYLAQGDIRALYVEKSTTPARTWTT